MVAAIGTARGVANPVSVTLLVAEGLDRPEDLLAELKREVIEVNVAPTMSVDHEPPATAVVLAWLGPKAPVDLLNKLVKWANSADMPVGVIGCATDGDRSDAEEALAAGFDDFVVGEVSTRELAARIRALSRRLQISASQPADGARFGRIVLDPARHQVWVGGKRTVLTRTELGVMSALIAAQGRAISRADLLDAAWGDQNFEVGERAVDNVVLRLRRKLADPGVIITVRGVGFRLAES